MTSIRVPQPALRLVSGEREPSAEPPSTRAVPDTQSWPRPRTLLAAGEGASRSPNTSELAYLRDTLAPAGYDALGELELALAAGDAEWAAGCCLRLSSLGELARVRAIRIRGTVQ